MMEVAVAQSVADKLADHKDVLDTEVDRSGGDVSVTAFVPDRHSKRRVKSELHQYPLYVHLEIRDA